MQIKVKNDIDDRGNSDERNDTEKTEKATAAAALEDNRDEDLVIVYDDFTCDEIKGPILKTRTQVKMNPQDSEEIENFRTSEPRTVSHINTSTKAQLHASDDNKLKNLIRSGLKTLFGGKESPIKPQHLSPVE